MNKVILIGRIGKDAETKTLDNGKQVINFSLATSEKYVTKDGEPAEATEWHRVVYFCKASSQMATYLLKGKQISIDGKLRTRSWENNEGTKQYITEILVSRIELLGGLNGERKAEAQKNAYQNEAEGFPQPDDLPF